ncbi:MAG: transposase zinc-binding domain-containing protein [Planctomycetota bacterium]
MSRRSAQRGEHQRPEFRGYLACGLLCFGFTRAACTGCGQAFVVAFSCKRRRR